VSVTVARDVTTQVRPPRAVFVPFRMGHHFGVPFHTALQRRIILEALRFVEEAEASGEIRDLDVTWAEARIEARALAESDQT
jgi:hypothetical protein